MKHIGVAGITYPGAKLCIETIFEESQRHFGPGSETNPPLTYTQPDLDKVPAFREGNWHNVAEFVLNSMRTLHLAGADFAIMPANSVHFAYPEIARRAAIPVLNLVDITVGACEEQGFEKVGVLGIGVTMRDGLYNKPLLRAGIEPVTLDPDDMEGLDALIYSEIVNGNPTDLTTQRMLEYIAKLEEKGCGGFIAGCTEIPIVVDSSTSPLPMIDTTRLLGKHAFETSIAA